VISSDFPLPSKNIKTEIYRCIMLAEPIPVAARSKAWVYGRSLAGIAGSNPAKDMDVCLL
jgi:hypothetical protein